MHAKFSIKFHNLNIYANLGFKMNFFTKISGKWFTKIEILAIINDACRVFLNFRESGSKNSWKVSGRAGIFRVREFPYITNTHTPNTLGRRRSDPSKDRRKIFPDRNRAREISPTDYWFLLCKNFSSVIQNLHLIMHMGCKTILSYLPFISGIYIEKWFLMNSWINTWVIAELQR